MWTLSCPLWNLFCLLPHSLSTDPRTRITTILKTNPTSLPLLWPQRISTVHSAFATLCLAPALLPRLFRPSEINQWFPVLNLKKTAAGWSTTCSSQPLCDNCGEPFLNSKHLCVEDDENDSQTSKQESSQSFEQDILDYNACCDVVTKDFYSLQDKVQILQQNCISLFKHRKNCECCPLSLLIVR